MHILYLLGMYFDAAVVFVTKFLLLFRLALTIRILWQHRSINKSLAIGWYRNRRSKFPSWQTVVRKYTHNQSRSSRFKHLEISRSKYLFREQIECNVYASYVICWCDNLFFRAVEHTVSFFSNFRNDLNSFLKNTKKRN